MDMRKCGADVTHAMMLAHGAVRCRYPKGHAGPHERCEDFIHPGKSGVCYHFINSGRGDGSGTWCFLPDGHDGEHVDTRQDFREGYAL